MGLVMHGKVASISTVYQKSTEQLTLRARNVVDGSVILLNKPYTDKENPGLP